MLWCDSHATVRKPAMRTAPFGYGFDPEDFERHALGDLDEDGDTTTDELFDLD